MRSTVSNIATVAGIVFEGTKHYPLNAECQLRKLLVSSLMALVCPGQGLNPRPPTLKVATVTIRLLNHYK